MAVDQTEIIAVVVVYGVPTAWLLRPTMCRIYYSLHGFVNNLTLTRKGKL